MHPIIAMWSHPRSMSTATERIMRERGDLDCAHEPFMYDYYVHRRVRDMPHFAPQAGHPVAYGEIREMLVARGDAGPVFFKDMAYYVMPRILGDTGFLRRLRHCFLVRDPEASIASYVRLDPDVTCPEIGLEAQWRLYAALAARGISAPVILAEDVRADPRGVIGALWQALGLTPCPEAFTWQAPPPPEWAQVAGWHGETGRQRGIRPITDADRARQRDAFAALAAERPHLAGYLDHHRPFYLRFREVALRG